MARSNKTSPHRGAQATHRYPSLEAAKKLYQMAVIAFSPDTPVNTIAFLIEKVANADFIPKKDGRKV